MHIIIATFHGPVQLNRSSSNGSGTKKALMQFQKANHLAQTGAWGSKIKALLYKAFMIGIQYIDF